MGLLKIRNWFELVFCFSILKKACLVKVKDAFFIFYKDYYDLNIPKLFRVKGV